MSPDGWDISEVGLCNGIDVHRYRMTAPPPRRRNTAPLADMNLDSGHPAVPGSGGIARYPTWPHGSRVAEAVRGAKCYGLAGRNLLGQC